MPQTISPECNLDAYNPAAFPTNFDSEHPTIVDIPGLDGLDYQRNQADAMLRDIKARQEQPALAEPPQLAMLPEHAYQGSLDRMDKPPNNSHESAPTPNQTGYLGRAAVLGSNLSEQVAAAEDPSFLDS